jgi:hypothetical protein
MAKRKRHEGQLVTRLRFGILGLSPGNGHPYSWSAIFNGYDPLAMASCPYPVIPTYLARQRFPDDAITDASVTHIWTQDRAVSEHIAAASRISEIVDAPHDMIGAVDGILLARDDADHHYAMAAPFLDAGLPIYIDKPIAFSLAEAQRLFARQSRPGQIFTCSALAYAHEFRPTPETLAALGRLRFVEASTIKDWDQYAIHVLEPLHTLLSGEGAIVSLRASGKSVRHLDIVWQSGVQGRVTALGGAHGMIGIRLFGDLGWREMIFSDTFAAFHAALRHFTDIVLGRQPPQDPSSVFEIVRMIEAGRTVT